MNGWWREDDTQNNKSRGEKQDKMEARDLKKKWKIFGEMSESEDGGSMGVVGQIGGFKMHKEGNEDNNGGNTGWQRQRRTERNGGRDETNEEARWKGKAQRIGLMHHPSLPPYPV